MSLWPPIHMITMVKIEIEECQLVDISCPSTPHLLACSAVIALMHTIRLEGPSVHPTNLPLVWEERTDSGILLSKSPTSVKTFSDRVNACETRRDMSVDQFMNHCLFAMLCPQVKGFSTEILTL